MQSARSSHHWLSRFSIRFMALRSDLPWQRVVARAVAAYPYCSDQDPDEAALAAAAPRTNALVQGLWAERSLRQTAAPTGAPR